MKRLLTIICFLIFHLQLRAQSELPAGIVSNKADSNDKTGKNSDIETSNNITAYESRIKELEQENAETALQMKKYGLLATIILVPAISYLVYSKKAVIRRNAIAILEKQQQLDDALNHLKQTEEQLRQAERMASLGELTAGIAHEIQNPLNFVNNFAEVNSELIEDIKSELQAGNQNEVQALTDDLRENNEKIAHHGKRADSIVKGMLKHSRTSSGQKEPTDINALAEEYLKLAYHGLRAKDKSFNATINTNFDNSIGAINVVGQDIGRVILNLITNAFYSINERQKQEKTNYAPAINVSTRKENDKIYISVADNGNGVLQSVMDKIFNPFFTTKPSGLGTGLGLSLSYDIIKQHEGNISVESKEGEGAKFTIELPA